MSKRKNMKKESKNAIFLNSKRKETKKDNLLNYWRARALAAEKLMEHARGRFLFNHENADIKGLVADGKAWEELKKAKPE